MQCHPSNRNHCSQRMLHLLKRAHAGLPRSAHDRQRSTPLAQKTLWAIHDKAKFQPMIMEIKGFNHSLASLFPNIGDRANQALMSDIDISNEIQSLTLLQQAAADMHGDISETTRVRLEALGATASAHSVISDDTWTLTERSRPIAPAMGDTPRNRFAEAAPSDPKEEELIRQMDAVENSWTKKGKAH